MDTFKVGFIVQILTFKFCAIPALKEFLDEIAAKKEKTHNVDNNL